MGLVESPLYCLFLISNLNNVDLRLRFKVKRKYRLAGNEEGAQIKRVLC